MRGISSPERPVGNVGGLSHRRTRAVLVVVAVALMTVVSAVSGLNVALPDLARSTGATQTQLTWVVDAYTVVFAGLLFVAGALGDRFGRKRLLAAGLVVFGLAAAWGLVTDDPGQLIALRALMGVGAAAIMPTTLSVITTSFPEAERPRAVGIWVGVVGGGAVLGLVVTATLLQWFPWNSFFGLNVALAALGLVGTLAVVPDSTDEHPPALDVIGAVLSLIGVSGLVAGVIEGPERGWTDAVTVGALAAGAVGLAAFVRWELRVEQPLLDVRLFRVRGFSSGTLAVAAQFFASFGLFFTLLQYLQFVIGYSPLRATLCLLPLPFFVLPLARTAPRIAQRVGFRRVTPLGLAMSTAGLLVIATVGTDLVYWRLAVGLALFGAGMGLAGTPATTQITASLPPSKQGVASAVNDVSREIGSALGIAILGSALNQTYRDGVASAVAGLPAQVRELVTSSIAVTTSPQVARFGETGRRVVEAAQRAFVDGIGSALLIAAAVVAVATVVTWLLAPSPVPVEGTGEAASSPAADTEANAAAGAGPALG